MICYRILDGHQDQRRNNAELKAHLCGGDRTKILRVMSRPAEGSLSHQSRKKNQRFPSRSNSRSQSSFETGFIHRTRWVPLGWDLRHSTSYPVLPERGRFHVACVWRMRRQGEAVPEILLGESRWSPDQKVDEFCTSEDAMVRYKPPESAFSGVLRTTVPTKLVHWCRISGSRTGHVKFSTSKILEIGIHFMYCLSGEPCPCCSYSVKRSITNSCRP
jgi:hypothetical protein